MNAAEYEGMFWGDNAEQVDYGALYASRYTVLARAVERLCAEHAEAFARFCDAEASWLDDYALFMTIKDLEGGRAFYEWPDELRLRKADALGAVRASAADTIRFGKACSASFPCSGSACMYMRARRA